MEERSETWVYKKKNVGNGQNESKILSLFWLPLQDKQLLKTVIVTANWVSMTWVKVGVREPPSRRRREGPGHEGLTACLKPCNTYEWT